MSQGTRCGIPTDLKITEAGKGGPKLKFKIDGYKCIAWATVKDGPDGPEYANPCIPAIKAAANEYEVAFDGWESVEQDWTDQKGNLHKGKPQIAAQRLVEASESIYGETFQDFYGIDAMGNKADPRNVPPGENPAKFYPQGGEGEPARATGEGARPEEPSPSRSEWADDGSVASTPLPQPGSTTNLGQAGSSPIDWLNDSYDSPYRSARITAGWAIKLVYNHEGDKIFGDGADGLEWTEKTAHLVRQAHALTERIVKGEL